MSGEEERFLVSLDGSKIFATPVDELKETLRLVMVKIGLRAQNWPSDEEKAVLISHIITQFGNHTRQEILLAFDMAIAGKLVDADDEPVSANCYENFSCLYFSRIMNAYRLWASEVYKQHKKDEPPMIEYKEDLSDLAMIDWFENVSRDVLAGKTKVDLVPVMLYEWMDKRGEINKSANDKREYLLKAAVHRQAQLASFLQENDNPQNRKYFDEFCVMYNRGEFTGSEIDIVKNIAKRMILFDLIIEKTKS